MKDRFILNWLLALLFTFSAVASLHSAEPPATKTPPTSPPIGPPIDFQAIQDRIQKMLKPAMAAAVQVRSGGAAGSGVIISEDGLVLTAGHVSATPGRSFKVLLNDGRELDAISLGNSTLTDSGMLQIQKPDKLPVAKLSGRTQPTLGEWCVAIGHPNGLDRQRGAVVRLGRIITISRSTLRTDCKLLGGDSGGPLYDLDGQVIGIHSRIYITPDSNFHVAALSFHDEWTALKESQIVKSLKLEERGYLGVLTEPNAKGARVVEVVENSPAAGKLKIGDIVTRFEDKVILTNADLNQFISLTSHSKNVKLSVQRDGKPVALEVQLARRPETVPPK